MKTNANGKVFNRRFKVWLFWFFALLEVIHLVLFLDKPLSFFSEWAKWSTIGLIAVIGGLSLTDAVFGRK